MGSGPPQPHSPVVLGCAQPTWRALGEKPTEGCALAAHLLCRVPAKPVTSGVAPDRTHSMCSKGPPQVWSTCSRCVTSPALGQPRPCAPRHLWLLVLLHSPPNVSRWLWAQGLCMRWSLCLKDSDIPTPSPLGWRLSTNAAYPTWPLQGASQTCPRDLDSGSSCGQASRSQTPTGHSPLPAPLTTLRTCWGPNTALAPFCC